jgi:hypothetical protein
MTYRQEISRREASVNGHPPETAEKRNEITIAGFPPAFVLIMTVIFAGVILLILKAFGLV